MDRPLMDGSELQQRLAALAERSAPPPRAALAELVVARHRRQRRRAVGVTALAAAVAAVVVTVPMLTGGSADVATSASAPVIGQSSGVGVLTGPTRGSLASDAAFVESVRQLAWSDPDFSGGVPEPPVDTRRVLFAGDVAGARWALVVGADRQADAPADDVAMAWFSGPQGAPAQEMQLDSVPYGVDPTVPLARADNSTGALVVVTAPGDTVEVSARPDVAADGSVTREWRAVDASLGVVVTTVPPSTAPYSTAVRYRVERNGVLVVESTPDGAYWIGSAAPVSATWLRGQPTAEDEPMIRSALDEVLANTGLSATDVTVTGLWAADVPGPRDRPARVALLAVTLPSGAVYLTAPFQWSDADGSGVGGSCGSGIEAAGVPLAERALAVRCDVYTGDDEPTGTSSLVVLAPGWSAARLVDMTGVRLADVPLVDGSTVVPAPERLGAVEVSGPDPAATARLRVLSTADLGD